MITVYYILGFLIWFIVGIFAIVFNVTFLQNEGDYNPFKDHLSSLVNVLFWPIPLSYGIKRYLTKNAGR